MNLMFVSAEVAPFSKTGGLGDVCRALPLALSERGHRVVTVSPAYRGARVEGLRWERRGTFWYWLLGRRHEVGFEVALESDHLAHVLIDNPHFDRSGLYGDQNGVYGDNLLRYALLSRASLDVPRMVPLWDHQPLGELHILHAHDWQAGLAPVYLEALYKPMGLYPGTRSVMTLHNAAHQGQFDAALLGGLELSARHLEAVTHEGRLNLLKAGIHVAHQVTAVSPSFAQELQTPEGGFGLDGVLRQKAAQGRMRGLLNGIDDHSWDPSRDGALAANYDASDMSGKGMCKRALQDALGLPVRPDVPLVGVVSRLDWQKGVELILRGSPSLMAQDIQLVVLGTGDPALEEGLRALASFHPEKVRAILAFDIKRARQIFAAADLFLVPSLFEPCGLTQMYAMRYGAVPVVRDTGGLRDTVQPWDPGSGQGTGWRFGPMDPRALVEAVGWAVHTWRSYPESFALVRRNGMSRDWSWGSACRAYEDLYNSAC
jgi:starch synthase